jgi:hypothetical protein
MESMMAAVEPASGETRLLEAGLNQAYVPALVGLAGVAIGALSSFFTTWLTQWAQLRERRRETERDRRERLFVEFIDEASRLFGDALTHEKDDVGDLVRLYALVGRMRLTSSRRVIAAAEGAIEAIVATYLAPNRTLHEIRTIAAEGGLDPLLEFGEACRDELSSIAGTIEPRRASLSARDAHAKKPAAAPGRLP